MISEILGKDVYDDIYHAAVVAGLVSEKKAEEIVAEAEKTAGVTDYLKMMSGGIKNIVGGGVDVVKAIPSVLGWTALLGAGTGVLGAHAYDVVKEQVTHEDPEAKFNADVEALYENKRKELEDAQWLSKVRSMRDELRRGYKKRPTTEYSRKYKALVDALDERAE